LVDNGRGMHCSYKAAHPDNKPVSRRTTLLWTKVRRQTIKEVDDQPTNDDDA
jgi:hypothetical protein